MGILHSICRFFRCEPEDEESTGPIYPYPLRPRQNSSDRLPKIGKVWCSIHNGIKYLLQFLRSALNRSRKSADHHHPVLPIQVPKPITEPLVVQSTLTSSPTKASIPQTTPFAGDNEELQCERVDVLSCQQWRPKQKGKKTDHVIVSVPEEDEEDTEKRESILEVPNESRIRHYSSLHRILLVGEGDFSFSASLAIAFSSASNIIATSLDSQEFLKNNYSRALSNIEKLRSRSSKVMHEIDATKMANHSLLGHLKFDRIIFNFPYAGLQNVKNLTRESQLRRHRRLVWLFLKNAREMISEDGEIHITHKTNCFHVEFDLENVASSQRLGLIEAVKFNYLDYPGYNTKCGFGGDGDFNCNPSKTYKFGLNGPNHPENLELINIDEVNVISEEENYQTIENKIWKEANSIEMPRASPGKMDRIVRRKKKISKLEERRRFVTLIEDLHSPNSISKYGPKKSKTHRKSKGIRKSRSRLEAEAIWGLGKKLGLTAETDEEQVLCSIKNLFVKD